ncbi:acyl-CoA dehydrogenase family protein [Streptomyces sp. NPDC048385]|uniref:acyl-CoA dehydrogenase family protein n=1 Tax=Streptomyces sp. NPDC048385 TaxID=3155145 RepID=UPI003439156A
MEFELDEEQVLLRGIVRETIAKVCTRPEAQQWETYLKLGWLEAPPLELALILEELGYVADPTPFLASATWFGPLAGRLPKGSGTAVFDGTGRYVLDADRADEIALLTPEGVTVVQGADLAAERVQVLDPRLHIAHVEAGELAAGVPALALTGLAATAVGACRRILDLVLEHVKQRVQFGRPLGSFQAVKHKAADMHLVIERARTLTHFAALTLAEDDPRSTRAAHMAKAAAGECQRLVVRHGLQLFGAMGFTWENELQYHLKRAQSCDLLLGTASDHRKALLVS